MTKKSGRVRVEDGHKRVRGYLGGELLFDTIHPKYVWELPYYPAYYVPEKDIRMELLTSTDHTDHSPSRGDASFFTLNAGGRTVENAAWQYADSPFDELRDHIRFEWSALDAWFEEDEEVIVHPRDPYSRVDVLRSSRHVQVVVDGTVIAESTRPTLLFETGLPARYYFPKPDVHFDLLEATDTVHPVPVQGNRPLLVGSGRRHGSRGPRLVVPVPAPRKCRHRWPGELLQREGRPHRRRRTARTPQDPVLLRS